MTSAGAHSVRGAFDLAGRVVVITGGAGLLGVRHGEAVAELGATPILIDLEEGKAGGAADRVRRKFGGAAAGFGVDITSPEAVDGLLQRVLDCFGRVDVLINNAANNPKVEAGPFREGHWSRLENFPLEVWNKDFAVGLTGAFLCSRAFGPEMARAGKGVILNVASDLGLIGPDQRIYRSEGETEQTQSVKPVSYSVVKAGLIGFTRYLATYWASAGVRSNALAPGGVEAGQNEAFVTRLTNLIPLGRMAHPDEYKAAVAFMVSDASSYMNGAIVSMDGGRTAW